MGHKSWVLEIEGGGRRQMEFHPNSPALPCYIVVPISLQMGWVESPPFFWEELETAWDVVQDYYKTKPSTLPPHKFTNYVIGNQAYEDLPEQDALENVFQNHLEVYVDNFSALLSQPLVSNSVLLARVQ